MLTELTSHFWKLALAGQASSTSHGHTQDYCMAYLSCVTQWNFFPAADLPAARIHAGLDGPSMALNRNMAINPNMGLSPTAVPSPTHSSATAVDAPYQTAVGAPYQDTGFPVSMLLRHSCTALHPTPLRHPS
jgi:hypothetical protein